MNCRKFGLVLLTAALASMMACGIEDEPFGSGEEIATIGVEPTAGSTAYPTAVGETDDALVGEFQGEYITSTATIPRYPRVGEPFTITGTFTRHSENQTGDPLSVDLWIGARNAVYLDGQNSWRGQLGIGEEKTLMATFAVVTEGNTVAYAATTSDGAEETSIVAFLSMTDSAGPPDYVNSWRGLDPSPHDLPVIHAPTAMAYSTQSALNHTSSPRVELIVDGEDLATLQGQGLLPDVFDNSRHSPAQVITFSDHFYVAVYGPLNEASRCMLTYDSKGFVPWNDGNLEIPLTTVCITVDDSPAAAASPLVLLRFARNEVLIGAEGESVVDVTNVTSINVTIDGETAAHLSLNDSTVGN